MERAGQPQVAQQQGLPPLLFRRQQGESGAALLRGLSHERWVEPLLGRWVGAQCSAVHCTTTTTSRSARWVAAEWRRQECTRCAPSASAVHTDPLPHDTHARCPPKYERAHTRCPPSPCPPTILRSPTHARPHSLLSLGFSCDKVLRSAHGGGVTCLALDPVERRYLLAGAADATLAVYDTQVERGWRWVGDG